MALAYIAERLGVSKPRKIPLALCGPRLPGPRCCCSPADYMNLSAGGARVRQLKQDTPENIIIISDDISLDVGRLRAPVGERRRP